MWPNLFLVGAAKAGTTSLYDELARHPAIYMSPMKEPHFFSRIQPRPRAGGLLPPRKRRGLVPRPVRRRRRTRSWWARRAPPISGTAHAAERIKRVVPEASILIMLRDPVERAYSQYWNDVREGFERRPFLEALAEEQRSGPGAWGVTSLYIDCGRYADQVAALPGPLRRPGPGVVLRGLRRATKRPRSRTSTRSWGSASQTVAPGRGGNPILVAAEHAQREDPRQRQAADDRPGHGPPRPAGADARRAAQGGQPAADGSGGAGAAHRALSSRGRAAHRAARQAPAGGVTVRGEGQRTARRVRRQQPVDVVAVGVPGEASTPAPRPHQIEVGLESP